MFLFCGKKKHHDDSGDNTREFKGIENTNAHLSTQLYTPIDQTYNPLPHSSTSMFSALQSYNDNKNNPLITMFGILIKSQQRNTPTLKPLRLPLKPVILLLNSLPRFPTSLLDNRQK